jgi:FHA domain.
MKEIHIDIGIIIVSILGIVYTVIKIENEYLRYASLAVYVGILIVGLIDVFRQMLRNRKNNTIKIIKKTKNGKMYELVLLNELNEEIRVWDITDKVSLIVGRSINESAVDIDLEGTEYEALIDYQHAVLNYTSEGWHIEDLYSKNGIRIRKQQDGKCYNIMKDKPCLLSVGDYIYIANTKLLFR